MAPNNNQEYVDDGGPPRSVRISCPSLDIVHGEATGTQEYNGTVSFDEQSMSVAEYSQISAAPSALRKGKFGGNVGTVRSVALSPCMEKYRASNIGRDTISDKYTMKLYDQYMTKGFMEYTRKLRRRERKKEKSGKDDDIKSITSIADDKSMFSFFSKNTAGGKASVAPDWSEDHSLPSDGGFPPSGSVLCQYTTMGFMLHQWKDRHWAKVGASTIAIFKSESDFMLWMASKDPKLVKKKVDLDRIAALKRSSTSSQNGYRVLKYRLDQVKTAKTRRRKKTM
jgi:hypothetical protein